jgi:hypothetical protein
VGQYAPNKQKILVDFYFYNYSFCKAAAFDARRISTFISIMCEIFQTDASSDSSGGVEKSFAYFQQLLLKHSVERPPHSVAIFKPADVEGVVDFALQSYFRNYDLYSYVFGTQTKVTIRQTSASGVEYAKVGMPLSAGVLVRVGEEE